MQAVPGTEMVFDLEKYQTIQMYDRTIVKESFAIQARYKQLLLMVLFNSDNVC
jgi:hypothetical protein